MSAADVRMTRLAVQSAFAQMIETQEECEKCHAGLILDHGLTVWPTGAEREGGRGKLFAELIHKAAQVSASELYEKAYHRWKKLTEEESFACWQGQLAKRRLFLGRGEAGACVLETAVTLHPVYGVPYIPGSTLKGLARAGADSDPGRMALQGLGAAMLQQRIGRATGRNSAPLAVIDLLFGRKPGEKPDQRDSGEAGHLLFHDAWWIPHSAATPLTPEVITVHHADYYRTQGETSPADWDAPIPIPQIAVHGAFLFAVEGVPPWAARGLQLLVQALQTQGVGGRSHVGYGLFQ